MSRISVKLESRQLLYGQSDSLVFATLLNGEAVALSAASFVVYWEGGTEIKKSGNASVATNVVTIPFDGTEFDDSGMIRVLLSVTRSTGGQVWKTQHLCHVVYHKLVTDVDDDTLKNYFPNLVSQIWTTQTNYQKQIDQAFDDVLDAVYRAGYNGSILVDGGELNKAVVWKTFSIIFMGFMKQPDDVWAFRYAEMEKKYTEIMSSIVLNLSPDESGAPTETVNTGPIRFAR